MDPREIDAVLEVADVLQIGSRNMQNYPLLTEAGRCGRPVLLKRGLANTIDELLSSADYILKEGNESVMLCERGIRTFETAYRFTLDLAAVPTLKERSPLPVIVDPSHAAGRRELVTPLSLAAAVAGADGLLVEVHPRPEEAICDGPQALRTEELGMFAERVRAAAAQQRPAGVAHRRRRLQQLLARLDRARPRDQRELLAADRPPGDVEHGAPRCPRFCRDHRAGPF